ncbi:hypothetical protein HDU87_003888 [Geranomyces variabilis]|uniref:SMP-LTD domain-containing protein n=1 Tax=Geranomyces variabilis TaxID=109894 RepID=A0AAD5TTM0_9FUNG|nr:hypothetical protein HDU87_003888 [Geranomyces variabilis]
MADDNGAATAMAIVASAAAAAAAAAASSLPSVPLCPAPPPATTTMRWLLTHALAFALGSSFTLLLLAAAVVVFIHWLPYYIYPVSPLSARQNQHSSAYRPRPPEPETRPENADEQLQMQGWIRWSVRLLSVAELNESDEHEQHELEGKGAGHAAGKPPDVRTAASGTATGGWRRGGPRNNKTFTQTSKDIVVSASKSAHSVLNRTSHIGSYLIGRFLGQQQSEAYVPPGPPTAPQRPPRPPSWHTAYAVLKCKMLYFYTGEDMLHCTHVLPVSDYTIDLYPAFATDLDIYLRTNPIRLTPRDPHRPHHHPLGPGPAYVYCPSNSEKEDWHVMLRRARKLPQNADEGACAVFFQDSEPVRAYRLAMEKLVKTIDSNNTPTGIATAWLNALVGRVFVGIHSNPALKAWVMEKLARRSMHFHRDEGGAPSFLGDIVIQDISVGNSIPVLSNPKLLELSVDGDMALEMDVEYTGGVRIEAATLATISINKLDLKPLQVPIVVGVQIIRFSARLLIKIKGTYETNRMWFGIQRDPAVKLEMKVEPLVGHKLISMGLVNQVIERRIKEVLEEFFVVPNLEDLGFWPSGGLGGMFWEDHATSDHRHDSDENDESEDESLQGNPATVYSDGSPRRGMCSYSERTGASSSGSSDDDDYNSEYDDEGSDSDTRAATSSAVTSAAAAAAAAAAADAQVRKSVVEAARFGEAVESTLSRPRLRKRRTFESLIGKSRDRLDALAGDAHAAASSSSSSLSSAPPPMPPPAFVDPFSPLAGTASLSPAPSNRDSTVTATSTKGEAAVPPAPWYYETLGAAADYLGRQSRYFGVDDTVHSLAQTAASYATPVVDTVTERTGGLKSVVGDVWESVGTWVGGAHLPVGAGPVAAAGQQPRGKEAVGEDESATSLLLGPITSSADVQADSATIQDTVEIDRPKAATPASLLPTPRSSVVGRKPRPVSMPPGDAAFAAMTPVLQMMGVSIHTRQPSAESTTGSVAATGAAMTNGTGSIRRPARPKLRPRGRSYSGSLVHEFEVGAASPSSSPAPPQPPPASESTPSIAAREESSAPLAEPSETTLGTLPAGPPPQALSSPSTRPAPPTASVSAPAPPTSAIIYCHPWSTQSRRPWGLMHRASSMPTLLLADDEQDGNQTEDLGDRR